MPDQPVRVLIVDDEALLMKALCDTLRDEGMETVGFTSAHAALAELNKTPFDLLLADLMMPEMDGITLLQQALNSDPKLVGIIMTGEGTIASAVEAMKKGALDYVLKPIKMSTIMPVLSRALVVRRLKIQNADLQQRVQERTAQLEAANKELEAFSFSVSHDLRAPLRAIEGFTNILQKVHSQTLSAGAQHLLGKIVANTGRMGQLIDDLLEFARLNRYHLTKRKVKTSLLVDEIVTELQKPSNPRIQLIIGELPDCSGDSSLLKQVFANLLSNAFKFTQNKKDPRIEVGSSRKDGENCFFVRDNGPGFEMKYADQIFEVFQRLHSADEFEGNGVGLSIVQRIIKRHGGRVWAEAELEKGATFYFTLPD